MSDAVVSTTPAVPAVASPNKATAKNTSAAKKPVKARSHPPAGEMVLAAITTLKDKKGSSLQAIKKYIAATYKCDVDKQSTFIRKYLKSAVEKKVIVQTKGSGAAGSFKLAEKAGKTEKKVAKKAAPNKPAAKKPAGEKKATAAKKPATPKKGKAAVKPKTAKSPSKVKKSGKAPAAVKPKTPKPKKAAAPKAAKPAKK